MTQDELQLLAQIQRLSRSLRAAGQVFLVGNDFYDSLARTHSDIDDVWSVLLTPQLLRQSHLRDAHEVSGLDADGRPLSAHVRLRNGLLVIEVAR